MSEELVGCDAVNAHIAKPIPDTLWHYTSYRGCQGIIASKKIWATEFRFLNDREEFLYGKALAQSLVEEEPERVGDFFPWRDTLRTAVTIAFGASHLHEERIRIMVASFSEEGDQLGQWRAYANDSRGVSIGLDLRSIRLPSISGTTVSFAPCVCKLGEKRTLLKAAFAHSTNIILEWWEQTVNAARAQRALRDIRDPQFVQQLVSAHQGEIRATVSRAQAILQFDLLRIAPLLKSEAFSEEKEWRLVLPWSAAHGLPTFHPIEFRFTRDALVPYIAFPLDGASDKALLPLNRLTLGPGSHPSAAFGVDLFLQKEQIRVLAERSKVSYRPP
jgi:hypothetical protein